MLGGERAEYGKRIVATLAHQLCWSHFQELLPVKSDEARIYYAQDAVNRRLGTKELRRQIARKAYERREIANVGLTGFRMNQYLQILLNG